MHRRVLADSRPAWAVPGGSRPWVGMPGVRILFAGMASAYVSAGAHGFSGKGSRNEFNGVGTGSSTAGDEAVGP